MPKYTISPAADSEVVLEVGKTGLMAGKTHRFFFSKYSGSVDYDAANANGSAVEFTVDLTSLTCKDDWVSEKDREKIQKYALDEELETVKYPSLTFRSKSISASGSNGYLLQGPLTIKDVTKPVTVSVTVAPGTEPLKASGEAILKLSDFKLKRPSAALGSIGTKDEIRLVFRLQGVSGAK